jgi:hypothetical protein
MSLEKPTDSEKKKIYENKLVTPASSINQINGKQKTIIVDSEGQEVELETLLTRSERSSSNNTIIPLDNGQTFTGTRELNTYRDVAVSCKTDQNGILYFDFSNDGTNWDTFPSNGFKVYAGSHEFHTALKSNRYFRTRFYNNSGANQTYLRLYTYFGDFRQPNIPANTIISRDADAILVRNLDFNLSVAESLYENTINTIKDGLNADIDTASTPEDIWNVGGTYTGFPTGAVEAAELVVAGADTGTVYYSYLASATSTDYVFTSKAIAGAATYALGHNIYRCNFMYFVSSTITSFNAGLITIRNTPTTANIFCQIEVGYSQSFCSAYTVPYGSSIYLDRITGSVRGSTSGYMDGYFWYRPYGESPRLRFPFSLQFGAIYFDDIDYLIKIPTQVDLIPRIQVASTNNLSAQISYRFLKIKE